MDNGPKRPVICFYAVASHLGGAERSLLELLRGLSLNGRYEPWVVLPGPGPLASELERIGVRTDVLEMPKRFLRLSRDTPLASLGAGALSVPEMALYLTKLAALLRSRKPSLIHTNAIKCHALAALVAPVAGVPALWHLRDIVRPGPTLSVLRALRSAPGARIRLVANSAATARSFEGGGASDPIPVVHNGLDPEVFFPKRNRALNGRLGVSADLPVVGIVGVLARWKGQLEFLRMASLLVKAGSPASFAVIGGEIYDTSGGKGYEAELKEEARRLGISDRVLFTGFLKDPVEAVNGLDVLVHASLKPEPFGRVIVEGLACGVPVVASADGGVLEIVEDGKTALLVRPGDIEGMAGAVSQVLEDPSLREKLVSSGRERFLSSFTREAYVRGIEELYSRLLRTRA